MVARVNETLRGLDTHRSYGTLDIALRNLALDLDNAAAAVPLPHLLRAWVAQWLAGGMALLVGVLSISAIIRRDSIDVDRLGLALASVLNLIYTV